MELPFAVESPSADEAKIHVGRDSSLHHSDSDSLVTASSQGSFIDSSNDNLNISNNYGQFIPRTSQDVMLSSPRHIEQKVQTQQQQQGQLVSIPSPENQADIAKDLDLENDFTYVNVTEIDADEDGQLFEGTNLSTPQDNVKGDILTVLLSEMQEGKNRSLLVSSGKHECSKLFRFLHKISVTFWEPTHFFFINRTIQNLPMRWHSKRRRQRNRVIYSWHSISIHLRRNYTKTLLW